MNRLKLFLKKLSSLFFGGETTLDMTVGNPSRVMVAFALPVLVSQLFQQFYNTADTFIVGKFLGTEALAAVSSSGTLIFLLIGFFNGTAMGAGVVIARYFGANDKDRVSRSIHTDLAIDLVSGVVMTVVGVVFTPFLLRLMNTDPEILPEAIEYFRYYFFGGVFLILYNTCRGIMNAVGDSKRPLYYLIFSSLLNIALDLLFVGGFRWGVWSAALATVISQAFSVFLCLAHLMKKGHIYSVSLSKIRFHRDMLGEILRYGLPSGVQMSVISVANVVVQSQINTFEKYATAAYGIHSKIEGFGFVPITSFTMAISTFVSQNLGAKQYERAKKGARFGILTAITLAELIGITFFFCAKYFFTAFDDTPEVIEYGILQARTITPFYFLLAFSHSIAAVCRGAGKAFVPMLVMLGDWCIFRILYIELVMVVSPAIRLIYLAYPITWTISSLIFLIYYHKSDWLHGFEHKRFTLEDHVRASRRGK